MLTRPWRPDERPERSFCWRRQLLPSAIADAGAECRGGTV